MRLAAKNPIEHGGTKPSERRRLLGVGLLVLGLTGACSPQPLVFKSVKSNQGRVVSPSLPTSPGSATAPQTSPEATSAASMDPFDFTVQPLPPASNYGETTIKDSQIEVFKLSNELEVMTISNPQFTESGAALAVNVGSYDDPNEALGLAHFLEHVIFISNEEYPQVDELGRFVSQNGGETNAYTGADVTNYGFSIKNEAFDGGLSRFSAFFKNPTFNAQFLEKEKNAVHSEFQKNFNSEAWRMHAVSQRFINPEHPASRFTIGSAETLASVTRDQVVDFYNKHYSANLMKLVLASPLKKEELKNLAHRYFESIKNTQRNLVKPTVPVFLANKKTMIVSKPLVDQHKLSVSFFAPLHPEHSWKHKVGLLFSSVLGDEGPGSLASVLKKEGLVLSLAAEHSKDVTELEMILTDEGRQKIPLILNRLSSFIKFAAEAPLPQELFVDRQKTMELNFKDLSFNPDLSTMQSLASQLLTYPGIDTFQKLMLVEDYRPDLYKEYILRFFQMDKAQIHFSSPSVQVDQVEPYFKVQYGVQELPPEVFEPQSLELFSLPATGNYFPKNFDLVKKEKVVSATHHEKGPRGEVIAKVDTMLNQPMASLDLVIYSVQQDDLKNILLNSLYTFVKNYELTQWQSELQQGHYEFGISPLDNQKIRITARGYSDQLPVIMKDFFFGKKDLVSMKEIKISEEEFINLRTRLKAQLSNAMLAEPFKVLGFQAQHLLKGRYPLSEYIQMVDTIQYADLQLYVENYFKNNYLKIYSYGNWLPDQSKGIYENFFAALGQLEETTPFGGDVASMVPLYRWPSGEEKFEYVFKGESPNNGMIQYWGLGEWNLENDVYGGFLNLLLGQSFFEELRTHQQVGYVAQAHVLAFPNQVTLLTMIQSQLHPKDLAERSTKFLSEYLTRTVPTITDEKFESFRNTLLEGLQNPPTEMGTRAEIFFMNKHSFRDGFDYQSEKIQKVHSATREGFQAWLNDKIKMFTKPPLSFSYYSPGTEFSEAEGVKQITEKDLPLLPWFRGNQFMAKKSAAPAP